MSHLLPELLTLLLTLLTLAHADGDVVVCGGFIKSTTKIPFAEVKVGVFSVDGILKESTECAPHNGYFLLPLYSKGQVSVRVLPPAGWTFSPDQIMLDIDGTSDLCSRGQDLNFIFQGFTVSGSVVSKGLDTGPSGVSVSFADSQGTILQHVQTLDGLFSISNVKSGTYTISLSHPTWKMEIPTSSVTVGLQNLVIEEPYAVISYDARGIVHSSGQPIAGVEIYLTPLSTKGGSLVEGCEGVESERGVCKVTTDTNGLYYFPSLSPGQYKIVPHYQSEHSTFDVSPNELTFEVTTTTVEMSEAFTVNGFAVIGRVLDALENGKTLPGVNIFVNGDKVAVTDSEGHFELSNVTSGKYEVVAKLKGYYFTTETLEISPNNPALPDIQANAYQLCGVVDMTTPPATALPLGQRKVGLRAEEDSNTALVTTSTDISGAFCFKVSPGKYILQSLIGTQEHRDGLRLTPLNVEVEVTSTPVDGVHFSQSLATLHGTVKCIGEDCGSVSVHVSSNTGTYTAEVQGGIWRLSGLLPGEYKVTIEYPAWCWKETEQTVTVEDVLETPSFEQSGYIMKLEVSHAAQLNFSVVQDNEHTDFGTFSLEKGTNRFCLKKPGVYNLVPYACHKFESSSYQFNTAESNELILTATQHLVTGTMKLKHTAGQVQVILTNIDTHDKITLEAVASGEPDDEGDTLFTYQTWSPPNQHYLVKPTSENLLFTPVSQTTVVWDITCPTVIPGFSGQPGTFVSGKVTPAVRGVLITLTSPDSADLKLTQITDDNGVYSIGPLHNNLHYQVSAEKQDYDIIKSEEGGHDFVAIKLSKLTVSINIGEGVLPGVLVSVSSTKGYRNNVLLEDAPLVLSGLVPGDYYIRPIMKEYQFTPSSKMLTITEGLEVDVKLVARRVAFSCYGKITTLNGTPQSGVVIEAAGAGDCALIEEGVSGVEGEYRIRGLPPNCPITISVRSDKSTDVRRASPKTRLIQVGESDTENVNYIIFHQPTTFDITGYIDIADEYILTTKVVLIDESREQGRKVHSSPLDQSRLFIFPEMDLSHSFTVKLESSLSPSMYNFKIPDVKLKSEGPYQHTDIAFNPIRKSVPQEQVTRASFTAVAIIVLSMVLAANHATLVPVFSQVYQSVMNRNSGDIPESTGETNGMEYIDDVHRSGIRRGKSRKR
ncbi:BOS complex subunit NOMO3-like isoform X2 [Bolinopsis microptera]|uniref:BOS complex subunit NOMO3-like isoform X1 n=1 Tax=Bolinopsis microptera TaxID=2820187 RepID=UPI003079CF7B